MLATQLQQRVGVEWCENRDGELYFVVAEEANGIWCFWERSTFEVRWFPIISSPQRIARAESLVGLS